MDTKTNKPPAVRETVWLVERDDWKPGQTHYYCGSVDGKRSSWTPDVHQARKFATKTQAEVALGASPAMRVREHVFGLQLSEPPAALAESEDDPAYLDGPFYYVPMPLNAEGHGPEMDPAKVVQVQHEVWNGHQLSVATFQNKAVAELFLAALKPPAALAEIEGLVKRLRTVPTEYELGKAAHEAATALELEAAEAQLRDAKDNWNGFIDPVSTYICSLDDFEVAEDGGPDACGRNVIATVERIRARAEAAEARAERLEAALRPLLSDKARKLLTDHANAAHAMEDRDYRAIADALRMLLDKDAKARAALSAPAAKGGDND